MPVYFIPTTRRESTSSQVFGEEARQSECILEILESLDTAGELEGGVEELQDDIMHLAGGTDATTAHTEMSKICLLYTSPSPRDGLLSRMPSSA